MFTTLTFITCLLWSDDMTFHVFELREKDLTRVKVLRIWDATYLLYLCTIRPLPAFPLTGCACRLFSSFIGVFFSNFSFCLDDGWQKKRDGFFPFDWGYRQKSDLTVLEKPLYLSDHPSPPPAKVRWLRFGLRQLSIIEGLLDDLLISVCDINAEQDNDEDAVLVHRLLYGCEKRRAFSKCRWIQRGTGIREGNWSQKASRKCFWDCYWGRACQLLANVFPYNSTRSLCERTEDRGFWNLQLMKRAWSTLRRGCDRQALFFQHRNICWFIFIWQELKQLGVESREWRNNALIV